jgi:endonuclease G
VEFAQRSGEGLTFHMGVDGPVEASCDFLQEIGNDRSLSFRLVKPLHIEERSGPDVAFFQIDQESGTDRLASPIALSERAEPIRHAAVIGYPAYDSRIPEPELMERIYGRIYNKKRLAPGVSRRSTRSASSRLHTLGGNSGSIVLDWTRGRQRASISAAASSGPTTPYAPTWCESFSSACGAGDRSGLAAWSQRRTGEDRRCPAMRPGATAEVTIPIRIIVAIGNAESGRPASAWAGPLPALADDEVGLEGRVEDYAERGGYDRSFLGEFIDLPSVEARADDVLSFDSGERTETELRYQHFSVLMSRSRRMCIFSACNIDGKASKKTSRAGWRWDPRIPRDFQIMKECYGSPPRFSRGHMTRREDPAWGSHAEADLGNEDSMHVTNAAPQMQAFNSPIWLALEDHALQHARRDKMKLSVFTGPYLDPQDPTMYGVRIPLRFWKVIAFIHDHTGELCATGYEMSQESTIVREEEYVFGAFTSPQLGIATQVSVASIERKAGISFNQLGNVDPLALAEEGVAGGSHVRLLTLDQIRFVP